MTSITAYRPTLAPPGTNRQARSLLGISRHNVGRCFLLPWINTSSRWIRQSISCEIKDSKSHRANISRIAQKLPWIDFHDILTMASGGRLADVITITYMSQVLLQSVRPSFSTNNARRKYTATSVICTASGSQGFTKHGFFNKYISTR